MQIYASDLKTIISKHINPSIYNELGPSGSTCAQKVFDIAELLEMILLNLNIHDLLKMTQVCRGIRSSMEASKKIQLALSLQAAPSESHVHLPFSNSELVTGGFACTLYNRRPYIPLQGPYVSTDIPETMYELRAYFSPQQGIQLPKIGLKYRSMFICNPPVKATSVMMDCCYRNSNTRIPSDARPQVVCSAKGLTIGDLYDAAKDLMDSHRSCPNAPISALNEDGYVKTNVVFYAAMILKSDDPVALRLEKQHANKRVAEDQTARRNAKLIAFTGAKLEAYEHGQPIPSLSEFEASDIGVDWLGPTLPQIHTIGPQSFSWFSQYGVGSANLPTSNYVLHDQYPQTPQHYQPMPQHQKIAQSNTALIPSTINYPSSFQFHYQPASQVSTTDTTFDYGVQNDAN